MPIIGKIGINTKCLYINGARGLRPEENITAKKTGQRYSCPIFGRLALIANSKKTKKSGHRKLAYSPWVYFILWASARIKPKYYFFLMALPL
jgi:hypothetical protein